MYQFYYSDKNRISGKAEYKQNVADLFTVEAIRTTMWEEHCLECAAPTCFGTCPHFIARSDGRCMRFDNGIAVSKNEKGVCGEAARVKFRQWANMMTIIFADWQSPDKYTSETALNEKLGKGFDKLLRSHLPVKAKWESVRTAEYARRMKLKNAADTSAPDAFIFHGYSFEKEPFRLIVEIFDSHTSAARTSIELTPGENIHILSSAVFGEAANTPGFLVKVYPENNLEAEVEILWCDFVKGKKIVSETPADKVKCVVWDLDNTVWDGILIETENTAELKLRENVLDTIKALDERGIIQSVASKNEFAPAWEAVQKLGISDYFLYPQIHWNAKSGSIETIAGSLNIGADTFALIDDSAFEREQVRAALPQVRTYDAEEITSLLTRPEFDVPVTTESKSRRLMYKAEEKRGELKAAGGTDAIDFLKKCNIRLNIFTPESDEEILRCYELVVRTNQLNMSGKKYTREEFDAVLNKPGHTDFAFSCEDDFGSYGIVGFGQFAAENSELVFTEFAMSCRVAGKYVESALFAELLSRAGCNNGRFTVNKTKKNTLLRKTLADIGFVTANETEESVAYTFTSELKNKDIVKTTGR